MVMWVNLEVMVSGILSFISSSDVCSIDLTYLTYFLVTKEETGTVLQF